MDALWNIFKPVVDLLQNVVAFFYTLTGNFGAPSYGMAIILMTVAIKMLLYPLTVKQIKSMQAMQKLQPKIKALQVKYKGNPQLLNQEMMKLYQEEGANPMAGCLPLLAQMPILMGMFYALRDFSYQGTPSFLWLPSLSDPDPYYILALLSAATTFYQQKQMGSEMGAEGAAQTQMKIMMYVMPLFIGYISLTFASGLVLYWVVMNFMQIAQQGYMAHAAAKEKKQEKEKEKVIDAEFRDKKPAKKQQDKKSKKRK